MLEWLEWCVLEWGMLELLVLKQQIERHAMRLHVRLYGSSWTCEVMLSTWITSQNQIMQRLKRWQYETSENI